MLRKSAVLPSRWAIMVVVGLLAGAFVFSAPAKADTPSWQVITPNSSYTVQSWPNWGQMHYQWTVLQLANDGSTLYDWYVVDSQVTINSASSVGYPAVGKICLPVLVGGLVLTECNNYGVAQAVGSSLRIDISSAQSVNEGFYQAPQPDTTQGSTTLSLSVGVQAGTDGASVTASYSISYSLPDVVVSRYWNSENIGSGVASYVQWSTSAAWNSGSAQTGFTVRTLSLIEVKENAGLQTTITFGGTAEAQCTDWICMLGSYMQYTWSSPHIALDPGFSLSACGGFSMYTSSIAGCSITVSSTSGWSEPVSLAVSVPAGISASISPTSVTPVTGSPASASLTISSGTTTGTFYITVTASSPSLPSQSKTVSISVIVPSGGGGGGCVAAGTLILTPSGDVAIQDLTPGATVVEYDLATRSLVWGTLVSADWQWTSSLVDINSGLLRLTPTDQPVYVMTPTGQVGWVHDPQNVTVGDQVFDPVNGAWIPVWSAQLVQVHVRVYDVITTGANNFIGDGVLLDMKA